MKFSSCMLQLTLALTCASAAATESAAQSTKVAPTPQGQASGRADNTNVNERDRGNATKTPQNQSNRPQDRELLAAVRRAVVDDKSLSTLAHNVKIVVEDGTATLRGPVRSAEEKSRIESLAKNVKGITATVNQLDVKTDASSK